MDYVVRSILDPNAAIKEEYLTKAIFTKSGQFVTGIEVERTMNQVVLKDATGKLFKIPVKDIVEEAKGKSLMPEGVTQILTKNELLDLIRFVSELGKPGQFAPPKTPTIQRWKWLHKAPAALLDAVPNRDELRDQILHADADKWRDVYSLVSGTLPLQDLHKAGAAKVVYLQGEVNVVQAGSLEVRLAGTEPAVFWIDEDLYENQTKASASLSAGRHTITVRVVIGANAKTPTVRVELVRPADSKANFEVVHAN
jgi:putative heme-binding domain-containing protein